MASIELPRVSAWGCHSQGIFENKGTQAQSVNLGVALSLLL